MQNHKKPMEQVLASAPRLAFQVMSFLSSPGGHSRRPYGASTVLKNDLMTCLPFTSHTMTWPWRMK
jgi:hypothetical protein